MPRNPLFLSWKKLLCRAQCLILDIFFLLSKRYLVNYPCFKSKTLLTKLCRSIYVLTTIPLANVNKYISACNGFLLTDRLLSQKKIFFGITHRYIWLFGRDIVAKKQMLWLQVRKKIVQNENCVWCWRTDKKAQASSCFWAGGMSAIP